MPICTLKQVLLAVSSFQFILDIKTWLSGDKIHSPSGYIQSSTEVKMRLSFSVNFPIC